MTRRLLEGPDRPLPSWLGAAWCGVAGYAMGTPVLATILESERFHPNGALGLLAVGLAPGLLSAAAGWLGARGQRVATVVLLTMVGALVASLFCAPLTWILLAVTGGETQIGAVGTGSSAAGVLVLVTIIGAFLAAPLGILFGMIFTVGTTALRVLADRPARSARDLAAIILGLGTAAIGAASVGYLLEVHAAQGPNWPVGAHYEVPWGLVSVSATIAIVGGLAALDGALRAFGRGRAVARARRGELPGWAVVDASTVEEAPTLPRLFAFGEPASVLVRRETSERGPFRSGETATAVAQC